MKFRFCAALLLAALCFTLFTGCAAPEDHSLKVPEASVESWPGAAEETSENPAHQAEDIPKTFPEQALSPHPETQSTSPAGTSQAAANTAGAPPASTEPAAALTAEEAEAIALSHAGFTADQVKHLHTEYDWDNGAPEYEVQFRAGRWEYEYDIHAETGVIRSFEKDD